MTTHDDQALTVAEITDLMDRLGEELIDTGERWRALRIVLDWGSDHGLLSMVGIGAKQSIDSPAPRPLTVGTTKDADGRVVAVTVKEEISAGPHDEADGHAAEEAGAAAGSEGPEGADRATLDVAPVPPVAGGGTSKDKPKKPRPPATANFATPRWTEDQDATAIRMKIEGATNRAIAEAVGRPEKAVSVRLSTRLKDSLRAAAAKAKTPPVRDEANETTAPAIAAPEARAPDRLESPVESADQAPAGAAEQPERIHAAPAAAPIPAPPETWSPEMSERGARAWYHALPSDAFWTPQRDFDLATSLYRGEGVTGFTNRLATQKVHLEKSVVIARWRLLCPVVTLHNQQLVLRLLKERAMPVAEAAE